MLRKTSPYMRTHTAPKSMVWLFFFYVQISGRCCIGQSSIDNLKSSLDDTCTPRCVVIHFWLKPFTCAVGNAKAIVVPPEKNMFPNLLRHFDEKFRFQRKSAILFSFFLSHPPTPETTNFRTRLSMRKKDFFVFLLITDLGLTFVNPLNNTKKFLPFPCGKTGRMQSKIGSIVNMRGKRGSCPDEMSFLWQFSGGLYLSLSLYI